MRPNVALLALVGAVVTAGILGRLGALVLAGARPVTTAPDRRRRRVGRLRARRRQAPRAPGDIAVAEWCEQAARLVRGGQSLQRAMVDASVAVPAAGSAFAPAIHAVDRGRGLRDALGQLDGDPAQPFGLAVQVLTACAELGGPAAAPLERTALTLHARAAERAERHAASAQARLSARVLTLLPVGTLGLLVLVEPDVRAAVASPPGLACVLFGMLANGVGFWWMRRIIRSSR